MTSEFVYPPTNSTFREWRQSTPLKLSLVTWSGQLPESCYSLKAESNVLKKHQNDIISEGIINLWEATCVAF